MIKPGRVNVQSRGGISDVTLVEIRSLKKAPCGPEITGADQKADPSGCGLYFMGGGPNGDR
jgi:hypothetical protein